ncbi:hypothetical protein SH580_21690 [Coraliomargarita algicola]|uniref:Uncharacterized protein n=1 Tax=Coraliomargarita algicola TaxID=3092156 RepID=A0ABZ0RKS7_9BACT|nr:hypothetical protein [Coraliomargarita sp. J2-16]WPJ96031.1 hypothetical protein SH580_21690 [Coraliomargarita sp. J2-16]
MHRKVIEPSSPRWSAAVSRCKLAHFEPSRAWRDIVARLGLSCGALILSAVVLHAAPDPDLFDGRVNPPTTPPASESTDTPEPGEAGGGESSGATAAPTAGASSENVNEPPRDFENVGGTGGGETVANQSSKDGASASIGSSSPSTETSDPTGAGNSSAALPPADEAPVSGQAGASGGGSGGASGGGEEPRNFEDFGFGGVSSQETVEVNRSKEVLAPRALCPTPRPVCLRPARRGRLVLRLRPAPVIAPRLVPAKIQREARKWAAAVEAATTAPTFRVGCESLKLGIRS